MMNSSKWTIRGLWLLGLSPLVLAWTMAYTGWGVPDARKNHGDLVQHNLRIPEEFRSLHKGRWGLLVVSDECNESCKNQLHRMHQLHKSTGKEFNRLQSMWISQGSSQFYPRLNNENEELQKNNDNLIGWFDEHNLSRENYSIWLLDPDGNLVLEFSPDLSGKEMLADIKWLLKASRMG
jgi:hypothetical protein